MELRVPEEAFTLPHPPGSGVADADGVTHPIKSRWPRHGEDEIAAVVDVLRSGRVNALVHGDRCRAFEESFAAFCGVPHAISLANGTLALELALHALGVGAGDEVILPARSFFATASCVVAVGAVPVFADVDPESQAIDPRSVRALVNGRTKAVICVHLAGWPCAMDELQALCSERGLYLVEDCAQAHGATYRGRMVGSFGDAAAFSFCTDKIMSTGGEGGMLLLKDRAHWVRAWAYKDHGKNPDKVRAAVPGSAFRYVHDSFGSNFRMTEMQAAIGIVQLAKLPDWLETRRRNAAILTSEIADAPFIHVPVVPDDVGHAYYKFCFQGAGGGERVQAMIGLLQSSGIPCTTGSCPDMSREHAFHSLLPRTANGLRNAAMLGERNMMLPVDHLFTEREIREMGRAVAMVAADFGDTLKAGLA